ncbi:MAG: VOC family protein [Promethearchaeota archaeon]
MTRIRVIGVYVDDIDEALDFYCNKLGFEVEHRYDECLVHLKNEGPPLILEEVEESNELKYPGATQVVLCIEAENLEEEAARLRGLGVEFVHDHPQRFPAGTYMSMRDPAGNVIELLQFSRE